MSKFDNRRRSGKVAVMLLSALFGSSDSQAKEMKGFDNKNLSVQSQSFSINKNDVKSPQSLERAQVATPITQRKFFKPLVISASALAIAVAGGFTIWGLTRNKKKDEKPDDKDALKNDVGLAITAKSIINLENNSTVKNGDQEKLFAEENINKSMIFEKKTENFGAGNEEIRKYNEGIIDNALSKAKGDGVLSADSEKVKKAIYDMFKKVNDSPGNGFFLVRAIAEGKLKISSALISGSVFKFFFGKQGMGALFHWGNGKAWVFSIDNGKLVSDRRMTFDNVENPFS